MSEIIVCKFGGSSIKKYEDVKRIKKIMEDDPRRKIIVVSAPGKIEKNDKKVTDLLISLAETREDGKGQSVMNRYQQVCPQRNINFLQDILKKNLGTNLTGEAYLDSVKALGEEMCARLLAEELNAEYVDPAELFIVSSDFGDAKILPESEDIIRKRLSGKLPYIVPGFYGYTKDGLIATFSRGGSDLTGAYIAASLKAKVYENFTDQIGVLSADPKIVENPKKIEEITFKEIRDLAYSGFGVFHQAAMHPVAKRRVPIHIRSTFEYPAVGTFVVSDRITDYERPIIGVAYRNGFCAFNVEKEGLNELVGVGRDILSVFADKGMSYEFTPVGIDDFSVVINQEQLKGENTIDTVIDNISSKIGEDSSVEFQDNLGILVVAGKGLKGHKGISAKIELALADSGVNIMFKSQGAKERCIIWGVDSRDGKKAVNAIYDGFIR